MEFLGSPRMPEHFFGSLPAFKTLQVAKPIIATSQLEHRSRVLIQC